MIQKENSKIMKEADAAAGYENSLGSRESIKWWKEARFGMFIHWGLYSIPAGVWNGTEYFPHPEWIMKHAKIPVEEYAALREKFNPSRFNAKEWVQVCRRAGMKYLVFTSKHSDGFCMFKSDVNDYNVVDGTPFRRDVVKELAEACREEGIKLCLYYSQTQDWYQPDGDGNDWDFGPEEAKNFQGYQDKVVIPHLTELLTHYGEIGAIWFDTPRHMTYDQSKQLRELVHRLQPDCLVSGRVGNGLGDFGSLGDHQIPSGFLKGDWETPATLNKNWGFRRSDTAWKSSGDVIRLLCDIVSKGANYLLNIGPDEQGVIPNEAVNILSNVEEWMAKYSDGIYGSQASPWPYTFNWGRVTTKDKDLYLFVFDKDREEIYLPGLENKVVQASDLNTGEELVVRAVTYGDATVTAIRLGDKIDKNECVSVIKVALAEEPVVNTSLMQVLDGTVYLPAYLGKIESNTGKSKVIFDLGGVTENWYENNAELVLEFEVIQPGIFEILIITSATKYPRVWEGGHLVEVSLCSGEDCLHTYSKIITGDREWNSPRGLGLPEKATVVGKAHIEKRGPHTLKIKAVSIIQESSGGLNISEVYLKPE